MTTTKLTIHFIDPGPTCREVDIVNLEKLAGCSLPADYRNYLFKHNGAQPKFVEFPDKNAFVRIKKDNKNSSVALLDHFIRLINKGPTMNLSDTYASFKPVLPDFALPIARDPSNRLFLLFLAGSRKGEIVYGPIKKSLSHPLAPLKDADTLGHVAKSFTDFIGALEVEPDDWDDWEAENT